MKYQRIIDFLENTPNQRSNFRTKKLIETNNDASGTYITNIQITFKTSMLKSSLCDYRGRYILAIGTIAVAAQAGNNTNNDFKGVVFENCTSFTDCISKIIKAQTDNPTNIYAVMSMYKFIYYSDNHSKKIWKFMAILQGWIIFRL